VWLLLALLLLWVPATSPAPPANSIVTQISTIADGVTTTPSSSSSTVSVAMGATHSASSQELQVLLSLLALLLLLLGGSLLLAWRMLRKRVKAGEHPEPLQTPSQGSPEELHYSTVAFDSQSPDSKANRIHSQKTLEREPEYSVIKQT
uniref:CD300a molecule n=1 Tax=Suricata suricatta TaxID=37032 RepID=A0A673V4E6_SURSU